MPLGTTVRTNWTAAGPDMDRYWRRVSEGEAVAHAIMRRLVVDRENAPLFWAPSVGFDVRSLLNESINTRSRAQLIAIETYVRAECVDDDRVDDASVVATLDRAGRALTLAIDLTLSDGTSFSFVMRATELTLEVLRNR